MRSVMQSVRLGARAAHSVRASASASASQFSHLSMALSSFSRGFNAGAGSTGANNNNNNQGSNGRWPRRGAGAAGATGMICASLFGWFSNEHMNEDDKKTHEAHLQAKPQRDPATGLPIIDHPIVFAPSVPDPISRNYPALVRVELHSEVTELQLTTRYKYKGWTFNGRVPGPFIRLRVGDTMEVTHYNDDHTGMQHNIDFHAVMGPGGGAPLLNTDSDDKRTARFKMLYPGLYVYHCAAGPLPMHVGNGMYGLMLVEPEKGLEKVDNEWYVMQSEFYVDQGTIKDTGAADFDYGAGLKEDAEVVVFNGKEGALTHGNVLQAKIGEKCRIFFGNGGPNLMSTFHVIGAIFEKSYHDGSVTDEPSRFTQSSIVGPGSAAMVEFTPQVPGNYTLVDHALFRVDKGCVGFISVKGQPQPDLYGAAHPPNPCPNCKLHP